MTPRNIFLTGGTGYMGSRLIPLLLARGPKVRALARKGSEVRAVENPAKGIRTIEVPEIRKTSGAS
jgi:uncharacterized protein YbjT (DUF2867 family)